MDGASVEGNVLRVQVRVGPDHDPEARARIAAALGRHLAEAGWSGAVDVDWSEASAPRAPADPGVEPARPIPGVHAVVAVASGKGGVGKSTIAVQLAVGLRDLGLNVGMLDADIYGPSLPTMLGIHTRPEVGSGGKLVPVLARGLACMSIGFLVEEGTPVIWRGPLVMSVVRQFLEEVDWPELDALVVDLPPGTGDAQLTMAQRVPITGAIIVSTPQDVALIDAVRGLKMFERLGVPVWGIVENMAWYELPGGGRDHPFGEAGAQRLAAREGVPLLAQVPLDGRIRAAGDAGDPAGIGDGSAAGAFRALATAVAGRLGR
ncbi:MAG: Mrp/NBP35 family ATP-binding protein [Deltaproteobacteria bacterium]|nr:Mrp/NBP35 family ATP-binding protein [Deltaproteobacteria bacterium]